MSKNIISGFASRISHNEDFENRLLSQDGDIYAMQSLLAMPQDAHDVKYPNVSIYSLR